MPRGNDVERFWSKVHVSVDGCWEWQAALLTGYGRFWDNDARNNIAAHRFAYELLVGPIPEGLVLDHLCRNRACVRPDHLEAVTHQINLLRGDTQNARNAAKTHCPQGHAYDEANTLRLKGGRECRACDREKQRRYRAERKAGLRA